MARTLATVNGDTVTYEGETTEKTFRVGPFLVHRGLALDWQKFTITTPTGWSLGRYKNVTDAKKAAKILAALDFPDWTKATQEEVFKCDSDRIAAIETVKHLLT